ncbi:MAG: dTMP kinase [Gammaproteobacteria bacterium]
MKRGLFITVEGGEGVGKTTHMETLSKVFGAAGKKVCLTREPGGSPVAESIRKILLSHDNNISCDGMAELLLMFAARADHLESVISPALEVGDWVVCDRFTDATYAYQGGGRGLDPQKILTLEHLVQGELQPDWTLLLDAPVETGLARVNKRGDPDRFELEERAFFERVRKTYLERAKMFPKRIRVVDATGCIEEVSKAVVEFANSLVRTSNGR